MSLREPEYRHVGNGSSQRALEEGLKYLKSFNKYLEKLPVRIQTLPDLLNALLVHYKAKKLSYCYFPHNHSSATDHNKESYPGRVVHLVSEKWEELLALPSKIAEAA